MKQSTMKIPNSYLYPAIFVYFITAIFSAGHLHPDEYYQILGFAGYKLGLVPLDKLTWEFVNQIRPTIQVWPVVYLYKLLDLFGLHDPFLVAFLTRLFAATLSLIAAILFIRTFIGELNSKRKQQWFILLSLFSYLIVFNSVRYSSENISEKLFIIAICLLLLTKQSRNWLNLLIVGLLLGISFMCRFQVGFMIMGLMAWLIFIQKINLRNFSIISSGILIGIIVCAIADYYFYGNWVFTPWNYFSANILAGKAASFGVEPWYMYLAIAGFLPYGILYVFASIYFIIYRPKHIITWIMLPFIFAHLLVGHKELRFLTPLLAFMPLVILESLQIILRKYNWSFGKKLLKLNYTAWIINCIVVIGVMFIAPAMQLRINKLIYTDYTTPTSFNYITEGGNILDFYARQDLRTIAIKNPAEISCNKNERCLIALTCQETVNFGKPLSGKLIFSDCPAWIFKINFNGWLERTALYNIYELDSD